MDIEDRKVIERYGGLSKMELSKEEQREIWNRIEFKIHNTGMPKRKRGLTMLTNIAVVFAAVAVVATGGISYEMHHVNSPSPQGTQVTPATEGGNNVNSSVTPSSKVMNHPKWTDILSNSTPIIKTGYGNISLSTSEVTNADIGIFLTVNGAKTPLYQVQKYGYKKVLAWQLDGQYLALKIGYPPNANTAISNLHTNKIYIEDVVFDLKFRKVLSTLSGNGTSDYFSNSYFIICDALRENHVPRLSASIVDLKTQKSISFIMPKGSSSVGVVANGRLYYTFGKGSNQIIHSVNLPKNGWGPLNNNAQSPIDLSNTNK